jgi:probable HAF family extracellular repeat protein
MPIYTYTTLNDLLVNNTGTWARCINDVGQIVGYYEDSSYVDHGFLYSGGRYTTLNDPLATHGTSATGINDAGQIVGYYEDSSYVDHGFLYSGGHYTTLDDPLATHGTSATGINDAGQIVGGYSDSSGDHGFLYSGGRYTTLDDPVITGHTGATSINDAGQIVGTYLFPGGRAPAHGFLANPVTTPPNASTITLPSSSTGDLGGIGGNGPTVIDASQTHGAAGATLKAGTGPETLYGAPNEDLIGGSGPDTFVFTGQFGANDIASFHASNDKIQLDASVFHNFSTMQTSGEIQQAGSNVTINDHAGDVVTLLQTSLSHLSAHNFLFV